MFALRSPVTRVMALAVIGLFLAASQADARAGRGGGFGSRGSRTWSQPAPTPTAPQPAQPIQRSTTPQQAPGMSQAAPRPGVAQPARSGFFGNRGGFLGGLVGAGLIGMLFGYGLFGGLGGLGSILGLLLQVALVVLLVRFAIGWWQRRNQPAYAGASVPPLRREAVAPSYPPAGGAATGSTAAPTGTARGREQVPVTQADLDQFERTLGEVQRAYGARDLAALDGLATPEIVGFLAEELGQDERRGVVNHIADVKLLKGDVAESWSEGGSEYATVAMRFGMRDWTTDAAGQVVEGDRERPVEATELWTFVRERGAPWRLAAIQQA
jgi:predicted lipid-binding transport protein (Tim44 family)